MREEEAWAAAICGLVSTGLYWWGQRLIRMRRIVEDVPTSKAHGVCIGLSEVKGLAVTDAPLTSYLAEEEVVWYSWDVKEHWRRTETYTDSKGRTQVRTVSGWTTVASGGEFVPFDLTDETGFVRVQPHGAQIEPRCVFAQTVFIGHPLYHGKGPSMVVPYSTFTRSFTENAILRNDKLYVLGSARLQEDAALPEITAVETDDPFLVSVRSEESIVKSKRWGAIFAHLFGALALVGSFIAMDGRSAHSELAAASGSYYGYASPGFMDFLRTHVGAIALGILAYLFLMSVGWAWLVYNGLVKARNRLQAAWSLIDVQLKRRHDLIPNLVAAVQGIMKHERDLQTFIAELRTAAADKRRGGSNLKEIRAHGSAVLADVKAVREAYPQLTADANSAALMDALTDTENRIALATQYANDCLMNLKNRMEAVPDCWVVRITGFTPEQRGFFTARESETAVPQVRVAPQSSSSSVAADQERAGPA